MAVVAPSTLLSALTVVESVWRQFEANEHLEGAVEELPSDGVLGPTDL